LRADLDGGGVADDLGHGAGGHHAAGGHDHQAVALGGLAHEVGADQHPGAGQGGLPDGLPQPRPAEGVDAGGGLVQDQQLWVVGEDGGEGDPPAQPQRQLGDQLAADRFEGGVQPLRRPGAEDAGGEHQVLGHGEVLVQP
jgi:hypothetical protein